MPRLSFLPTIFRELLAGEPRPREPEPDLVMEDDEQVASYALAGRVDGVMSASYLFHTAAISEAIAGSAEVVDLACGPATQLAQVAQLNPGIRFHGIDLSATMLESAKAHVDTLGLTNVRFSQGDIANLDFIADHSAGALISTMALHHLPTVQHLDACFAEIARVVEPEGAVYLADFGRLRSLRSVLFFAYMNAKEQPHLFSLDYERSLRAAFTLNDFQKAARERLPSHVRVYSTFLVPMLATMRTPARSIDARLAAKLRSMRKALPRRYRADLDDMRLFFRLNGLASDPFR